jgi:protein TonB
MERPSHIIFDTQSHNFSRRLPVIGLALSLQFAGVWLFTHGLLMSRVMHFGPGTIEVVKMPEIVKPSVEPPKPKLPKSVKKETVLPPIFNIERTHGGTSLGLLPPPTNNPPARGFDRALAAVPGTHTVPPYPPIARRIGAEGKVTLRLTVSAEGKVTAAEVVSSSGRDDMDQSAQQWIMAHWAYKAALDNGVPVIGHVLATVNFNLINER